MGDQTISMTDPYWQPGPLYSIGKIKASGALPRDDLGFRHVIPVPMPITIGNDYFGSNEGALNLPKTLVHSNQGEYFLRGGYLGTTGGRPMVNVYKPHFNFSRSDVTDRLASI